jgi:uncharacterized membrane protein
MAGLPTPAPVPPRRSWGRIALIVALVLSLVGNAVALGAWVRFREVRDELLGPEAAEARLPGDLRRELRSALREDPRETLRLLRDVVRARVAIVAATQATPYSRSAAEEAMTEFRRAVDALLAEVQAVFLDRLDKRAGE